MGGESTVGAAPGRSGWRRSRLARRLVGSHGQTCTRGGFPSPGPLGSCRSPCASGVSRTAVAVAASPPRPVAGGPGASRPADVMSGEILAAPDPPGGGRGAVRLPLTALPDVRRRNGRGLGVPGACPAASRMRARPVFVRMSSGDERHGRTASNRGVVALPSKPRNAFQLIASSRRRRLEPRPRRDAATAEGEEP